MHRLHLGVTIFTTWVLILGLPFYASSQGLQTTSTQKPGIRALTISQAWQTKIKDLESQVDAALQQGDFAKAQATFPGALDLAEAWFKRVRVVANAPIVIHIEPYFPCQDGILARVYLHCDSVNGGNYAHYERESGHLVANPQVTMRPWTAASQMKQLEANIIFDPLRSSLAAEVTATILPQGDKIVPLKFCIGKRPEMHLQSVKLNGIDCPIPTTSNTLFVWLPKVQDEVKLAIRYEGIWRGEGRQNYIRPNQVVLPSSSDWLPSAPGTRTRFEITIKHPRDFELFGQGIQSTEPMAGGLAQTHWSYQGSGASSISLYGGLGYVKRELKIGGTTITLAVEPRDGDCLDTMAKQVDTILKSFSPLGVYPYPQLRIVETGFASGNGNLSNLTVNRVGNDVVSLTMLAHEMAHSYFAGVVPQDFSKGLWAEGLAEYASSWCLDQTEQAEKRKEWSQTYARLDPNDDCPVPQASNGPGKVRSAVLYRKAALIYSALADRVGQRAMDQALKSFIEERRGQPSTWDDLFRVFTRTLGPEHADWAKTWLTRTGAPDLQFKDATVSAGVFSGNLVQTANPPFTGVVEIGFQDGSGETKIEHLSFALQNTPFCFKVPPGTKRIILDPDYRLPRQYDPKSDPVKGHICVIPWI